MFEIIIDGVIGWDYTPKDHREKLKEAAGDDLDIQLNTPGGSVYDGNVIKQLNEKYSRDYPNAKVNITTYGISASMGSVIALSGDKHFVHEDSTYMIHNAWIFEIGDHRQLRKTADLIESLTDMSANTYSQKTGKNKKELRQLMDDETWLYGQEIVDNGFADAIIKKEKKEEKKIALAFAQNAVKETLAKMKADNFDFINDMAQAVAMIPETKQQAKIPASAGKNKTEGNKMTLDEFKKNHPELYAHVLQEGKDKESDRVNAHITMGRQCGNIELAAKNIEEGKEFNHTITAEYMAEGMKNTVIQNRKDDDPGSTETETEGGDDKKDTEEYKAKLLARRGIK